MKNDVNASPQGKFWRVAEHRLHILPCVRRDHCVTCPAVVKNAMESGKVRAFHISACGNVVA